MTTQSLVRAPYAILCEVLGHPQHRPPSGERVLWAFDVAGTRASMREQVKAKPSVDLFDAPDALWLVTADDDAKLAIVCKDVARRVIDVASKRAGGRALRPEDKAKLNELVRQGVPLGEAMKRVRTEIVDDHARALYAWPVVVEAPPPGAAPKVERARAPASPDGDEGGEEAGDEGGDEGEEIDSGDDEGGGDISGDDDDRPAPPAPKAARPARGKPGADDMADDMGGELSGLARLLGALTPKPKPVHNAPATTATSPAPVPAAKPAAKPAALKPAALKPATATPAPAKPAPTKPAPAPTKPAPAKKTAAKKPAPAKAAPKKPAPKKPVAKATKKKVAPKKR